MNIANQRGCPQRKSFMFSPLSAWNQVLPKTLFWKDPTAAKADIEKPYLSSFHPFDSPWLSVHSIDVQGHGLHLMETSSTVTICWGDSCLPWRQKAGRMSRRSTGSSSFFLLFPPARTSLILVSFLLWLLLLCSAQFSVRLVLLDALLIHDEKSQRNFWKAGTSAH